MTREELQSELIKIDQFIEVLQDLIQKPLCGCLSKIEEQFKESNINHLDSLLDLREILLPLKSASDEVLAKVMYSSIGNIEDMK